MAAGALGGAVRASGSRLRDQRVVLLGAGSAGIGVADMLRAQMVADGIADAEARRRFFVVDRVGLLTEDRSEADPADLARWTDGRVLVATGSPYPPLEIAGKRVPVAQCNNVFVFPAVGLGVVASRARRVTDGMLEAAARALGELSPARSDQHASLLPPVDHLRATATEIAAAVAIAAVRDRVAPPARDDELRARVAASQ